MSETLLGAVPTDRISSPDAMSMDPLNHPDRFVRRHIGPDPLQVEAMLKTIGKNSLADLIDDAVPASIRLRKPLHLGADHTEYEMLHELKSIAGQNQVFRSYIGMGYHDCIVPPVIQRNILENPGWYTQYTPYQAEIAQGRLEALLNFQTMVTDLTAMEIANASLLDEATAAAEAMHMCHALKESEGRKKFFVSELCHPQNIELLKTRARPLGIEVVVGDHRNFAFTKEFSGGLFQYPDTEGTVHSYDDLVRSAHEAGSLVVIAADLLSLAILRPPGEFGADIVVGSAQRFGVPLGYGGPHAAFFATRDAFRRQMPGRLVGVSRDLRGKPALRLALQTREQHIRREKATSNICTAQALLASMASMYAVYHGPAGLLQIARKVHALAQVLARGLKILGCRIANDLFFDTLKVSLPRRNAADIARLAEAHRINLRIFDEAAVGISLNETTGRKEIVELLSLFNNGKPPGFSIAELSEKLSFVFPPGLSRKSDFLRHPVFNQHHSETEMLRYIRRLESRDLSLTSSMIPLGSCTMKLNATAEMFPVSWPEFSRIHPFAPLSQAQGYQILFRQLEQWLAEITGFAAVSLQPNAGSQGEYAGLLAIHRYHESRGEQRRNICLIPTSAHGTNPASAVMAGLHVVPVACDSAGNIDVNDLRAKSSQHRENLSCLMITYPSTHGVFEESVQEICSIVHENGGQVYMDGANMNAQVGLCRPGDIGADVCHLNLHKTFCIPHGGGGPGMGPICVASHLTPFLPGHAVVPPRPGMTGGAVSASTWGSASILTISWAYIAMMGGAGLTRATEIAILNANYIARRLENYFPVLFKGAHGLVAHECILDLRKFKKVTVEDVAKRLMDYGFHAPTISWPVPGTMMVEPTESESREELDRFCDALILIHQEILEVENGSIDPANNPLKNAPHTADQIADSNWNRPYSRERAAFPGEWLKEQKFWPHVSRIDNVFGDRNLVCSCVGMEAFA